MPVKPVNDVMTPDVHFLSGHQLALVKPKVGVMQHL
jgi:hypothetical protein